MPVNSRLLLSSRNPALLASTGAYLAALSFGYVIGYTVAATYSLEKDHVIIGDAAYSWFGSLPTLGALFACPVTGWLVDKFGQRSTLLLTTAAFIIGWIVLLFGGILLYTGRALTGFACGMMTVISPMYVTEISTRESRGLFGSGIQLAITVGILLAYVCGLSFGWHGLALIGVLISVVELMAISRWSPESPRYLVMRNERKKALSVLRTLRSSSATEIEDEFRDIEESAANVNNSMHLLELVTKKELLRPLVVAIGLLVLQQLTGINAVLFYLADIFRNAGLSRVELAPVIVGVVQVVATVVSCYLMDRAGRRVLLMVSGAGLMLSSLLLGFYYYWAFHQQAANLAWMPLTMVVFYIVFFSLGFGPVPSLIATEIFPSRARGTACSVASVAGWAVTFLVTKEFGDMVSLLHEHGAFWVFSGCCAFSVVFVNFLVPETRGKALEDIELFFMASSSVSVA